MKFIDYLGIIVLTLVIAGCTPADIGTYTPTESVQTTPLEASDELLTFSDITELTTFLQQRQVSLGDSGGLQRGFAVTTTAVAESSFDSSIAVQSTPKSADFSSTNVQYQNVDEADFIKNDGRYIYMIADNKLLIVDGEDAETSRIISETRLPIEDQGRLQEIFLHGDTLAIFVNQWERSFRFDRYDITPRQSSRTFTYLYLYDVSDRSNPEYLTEFKASGGYFQSRLIGDTIYAVTREAVYSAIPEPLLWTQDTAVDQEIVLFDNPEDNYQFNMVFSVDIDEKELIDSKTFMLGFANTLMVSEENMYIAYQKNQWWGWWRNREQFERERFFDVILPLLEGDLKQDVNDIIAQGYNENKEWLEIASVFADFYKELDESFEAKDQYESMFERIAEAVDEYDTRKALQKQKTTIHKININDGRIAYDTKGEIDGHLLNQFSLDETDGYLRVASSVNAWTQSRSVRYSNVYIFDENMRITGTVEEIAPNEQIFSTRFLGDKLYMVTFERIDPFFVVDLDPNNPKILGELKLPGFSQYLHPFGEDHIIGIGKETDETSSGRVVTEGVKMALFDVSDPTDPTVVDEVIIGESGSDTPITRDHKAFLFAPEKDNLLVLPVREIQDRSQIDRYRYSYSIWDGALLYTVSEDGFELRDEVRHDSASDTRFWWWGDSTVQRSLYIGDTLYTVSGKYIRATNLDSGEEVNTINLPGRNYRW